MIKSIQKGVEVYPGGSIHMPNRFLNQYDEAQSLLTEAINDRYPSGEQRDIILQGLRAINILRADAVLWRSGAELAPA
jgi:hypothetical protein